MRSRDLHPQRVGATVLEAIAERNALDTATVDDIIWGTSNQSNTQGGDLARMAALDAGYDPKASGVTLDRFCGSGITSSNLAAGMIMSGLEDVIIAGGTDMMSSYGANRHPNSAPFIDAGNAHLRAIHPQPHQGVCARRDRHVGEHPSPRARRAGARVAAACRRGPSPRAASTGASCPSSPMTAR